MSPGYAPTPCRALNGCTGVAGSNLTLSSLYSLRTKKGKDMRAHCGRRCLPWRAKLGLSLHNIVRTNLVFLTPSIVRRTRHKRWEIRSAARAARMTVIAGNKETRGVAIVASSLELLSL